MSSSKKSIKYIAPIGNSGYAEAAKDYMVGLHRIGVDVTFQYFKFDNTDEQGSGDRHDLVLSLVNREIDYDTVIIHSTPEHWPDKVRSHNGKKIIGMTVWETTKLHPDWVPWINMVHEVVVPCEWNKKVFQDSGIIRPIKVVPHIMRHQNTVEAEIKGTEGRYVFYTIGQWHNRKGIDDTIRAYLTAFNSSNKDVVLVVKAFSSDFSEGQKQVTKKRVQEVISEFSDPADVVLINEEMTQEQMEAIHTVGDCYVSLCKSEGWGLGAFDAAARGKPVIMTGFGGQMDFLKKGQHKIVSYKLTDVDGMPWIPWYLKEQQWAQPNIGNAAQQMKEVYLLKPKPLKRQVEWMKEQFNEITVSHLLKRMIK